MPDDSVDIRLLESALDPSAAIQWVTTADAGGIDVFVGTTRSEAHPELGNLLHLDYHAYNEMAVSEMRQLAVRARSQWPVARIAIWHRLGAVAVGQASVVIAVSCPHRGDAFAACRFVIDSLKETVPIWKREVYAKNDRWQSER